MIKLKQYHVGWKLIDTEELTLEKGALSKSDETHYVLLIPQSAINDLKKGDIGEWG